MSAVTQELRFVEPEQLISQFRSLGPSVAVTEGVFELDNPCPVEDMDWNHLDQLHRPCIHRTYQRSCRMVVGRSFAVSLTRLGRFGFWVVMTDVRLGPGFFYQMFSLFNLMYVHTVIRQEPLPGDRSRIRVQWFIVSNRLFRFLHPVIDRRLQRLNRVQNEEDLPIRDRRAALRKKGYRFRSDEPDFISSNQLTDQVLWPAWSGEEVIPLGGLKIGSATKTSVGAMEFLLRREADGAVTVWPAVCPHEGGPLEEGIISGEKIICPWHELTQHGMVLGSGVTEGRVGNCRIRLEKDLLRVTSP